MNRNKIIKLVVIAAIIIGGAIGLYLFNMPHRDVQSAKTDFEVTATALVNEYLENAEAANQKYLAADGNSKILEVTGTVHRTSTDFRGQTVIELKDDNAKAGVSINFAPENEADVSKIAKGDIITAKGVISLGAAYDTDMKRYRDAVIGNAFLIKR